MSGTSADGIDAVLSRITAETIAFAILANEAPFGICNNAPPPPEQSTAWSWGE